MSTLPRGVQQVTYKDSLYFRVRISRKNFKADKYFKNLEEAKEFLALSKAKKGKELIYSCRIPDDCIDSKRYPLFMARDVMRVLIEQLQAEGATPS